MTLYKNVDICDLESILKKGILSLDESGNDNWDSDKRANNPTDCVYLFLPINDTQNAFPNYGTALLEVEIEDAEKSDFCENDTHKEDYVEYVTEKVEAEQIKRIIIPAIFKERLEISENVEKMVEWCGFSAEIYGDNGLEVASDEVLEMFAGTADIEDSSYFNFFRGTDEKRHLIDLYNIRYIF